jgi:tetratricopeptide (TPR) repeat protein
LVELAPDDLKLALSVGNLHYEVGHLAAAAEQFERATKLTPQQATAHALLASLRVQQERFAEAEASARRALELEPLRLDMLRLLAALTRHAERFAEAGAYYASIVRLAPRDFDARLGQAVCSAAQGHCVLAELILEEVFELQPDHPEALALRAQLNGKHESGSVTVESSQPHLSDRLRRTTT